MSTMRFFVCCLVFFQLLHSEQGWSRAEPKTYCEVLFSPKDQLAERLIQLIDEEDKSIHVAIYCLTHRGISEALIKAKRRGVEVEVIIDPFSAKSRFPAGRLASTGIPVFVWDPPLNRQGRQRKPLMHNKFCILGLRKVWTGSFNFTYDASLFHRENALIIEDSTIAKKFLSQFRAIKNKACLSYDEYLTVHPPKKKGKK